MHNSSNKTLIHSTSYTTIPMMRYSAPAEDFETVSGFIVIHDIKYFRFCNLTHYLVTDLLTSEPANSNSQYDAKCWLSSAWKQVNIVWLWYLSCPHHTLTIVSCRCLYEQMSTNSLSSKFCLKCWSYASDESLALTSIGVFSGLVPPRPISKIKSKAYFVDSRQFLHQF